jgi:hypothetical protein
VTHPAPSHPGAVPEQTAPAPPPSPVPEAFQSTPDAERYVLQADALRRRQLRAALLYGSSRYWRRRHRVWPSIIAGVILAALVAGVIVVIGAFENQRAINAERNQGQQGLTDTDPLTPLTPQSPQERTTP